MWPAAFLFVDRHGQSKSMRKRFAKIKRDLGNAGSSMHLLFFAEGHRARNGRLKAFIGCSADTSGARG
jgi:hypothetical protein